MADQTILDNKLHETIVMDNKDIVEKFSDILVTNGADMSAGMFITREGETGDDIDVIDEGEAAYGIIRDYANERSFQSGYTLGNDFPDNTQVKVLRRAAGIKVQCVLFRDGSSSLAVALGDPAYVLDNATWGPVLIQGNLDPGTVTNFAPATTAQRDRLFVGRFAKVHAVGSAENLVTIVRLEG